MVAIWLSALACQRTPENVAARTLLARVGNQTLWVDNRMLSKVSRAEVERWVVDARYAARTNHPVAPSSALSRETARAAVRALLAHEVEVHTPSEADERSYFAEHKADFDLPEMRIVAHFVARPVHEEQADALAAAERYATRVLADARASANVRDTLAAAADNIGRGRSFTGSFEQLPAFDAAGHAGTFDLDDDFVRAAFAVPNQQRTPVLARTRFGYHVIAVLDVLPAQTAEFGEVSARIDRELRIARSRSTLEALLSRLQSSSRVVRNEPEIEAFMQLDLRAFLASTTE